ncbi:hypothetical protein C8Q78DRAFT_1081234 [Trametes maxima]|nr:hypothetical protein C8Q78DRAFT_1081234 [Trametes maxima]
MASAETDPAGIEEIRDSPPRQLCPTEAQKPKHTPRRTGVRTLASLGDVKKPLAERRKDLIEAMAKTAVYLPLSNFQSTLLPLPRPGSTQSRLMPRARDFSGMADLRSEKDISRNFTAIVNGKSGKDPKGICPGYKIALSEDHYDPKDEKRLKVDGALYHEDDIPKDGRPRWEKQRLLIEFKRGSTQYDPFHNMDTTSVMTDDRKEVYGQVGDHVARAFVCQQRTALFLLLVAGTMARMTRWDHSGVIYTDAIDYVKNSAALRDLIWGFTLLSLEKQGFDLTASIISPGTYDYELMDDIALPQETDLPFDEGSLVPSPTTAEPAPVFAYVREMFAKSLPDDWPRWRLLVPTPAGPRMFFVGKPVFDAPGPIGRCTRGYVALDPDSKRFVWLKDTWRPNYLGVDPEGNVLQTLRDLHARNIPTFVCHGDLEGQDTQSPQFFRPTKRTKRQKLIHNATLPSTARPFISEDTPLCGVRRGEDGKVEYVEPAYDNEEDTRLRHLRHYRLVVSEVCLPLQDFTRGHDFVSVIRDCVRAHSDAATSSAKLLHRDISIGNILILPTTEAKEDESRVVVRHGILTDWELAKPLCDDESQECQRQPERTGTWQFISAFSLDNPTVPMKIEDDLESFFYVTLYIGVRYLRHNCGDAKWFLTDFFDSYSCKGGNTYLCGSPKRNAVNSGEILLLENDDLVFCEKDGGVHWLDTIITEVLAWLKARYAIARKSRPKKRLRPSQKQPEVTTSSQHVESVSPIGDHVELLRLLDEILAQSWPMDDKIGDQLLKDAEAVLEPEGVASPEDAENAKRVAPDEDVVEQRPTKRQTKGKVLTEETSAPTRSTRKRGGYVRQRGNHKGGGKVSRSRKK